MTRLIGILKRHGLRAIAFLAGSVMAQGSAAVAGLLLAWWLPVNDYALYTIMILLMSATQVLTKGGVHAGFTAILGREWPNMNRVAEAISAALKTRRMISAFVLPILVPMTALILFKNGASPIAIAALLGMLLLGWWADIQTRIVDQVLFFAHQTSRVQFLDAGLAILRVLVIIGLYQGGLLTLLPAVLLGVLVALLRVRPIIRWVKACVPGLGRPNKPDDLIEIRAGVIRVMPVELYTILQMQIILVILTFFAQTSDIAGYGALTRLNQLLVPVHMFTVAFSLPIFTRATHQLGALLARLVILALIPGLALVLLAWLAPQTLLWLIGPNYAELGKEVLLAMIVFSVLRTSRAMRVLVTSRGWVKFNWLQIPLGILWMAIAIYLIDMSTLTGALLLQLGFATVEFLTAAMDFQRKTCLEQGGSE